MTGGEMFNRKKNEPAAQIPVADAVFLSLQVESAKLRAQQEIVNLLMRVLQGQYGLPDGATIDSNGKVKLPA